MHENIGWVNFYSNVFFLSWVLNFEHSPIKFSKPGATSFLPLVKTNLTWWRQLEILCFFAHLGELAASPLWGSSGQLCKWRPGHKHLLLLGFVTLPWRRRLLHQPPLEGHQVPQMKAHWRVQGPSAALQSVPFVQSPELLIKDWWLMIKLHVVPISGWKSPRDADFAEGSSVRFWDLRSYL